ncbi:MAG: phosphatase PAP2 family protein [Gemmatimonadetes bacterium]|nr:phosphatase PAP2 family protein [Gemmatimonadota bacterium]
MDSSVGARPIDRLIAAYALVSGAALVFPHRGGAWPVIALLHGSAALAALRTPPFRALFRALSRRWPRATAWLGDWYPLLLIPVLYAELPALNLAVHGGAYFDDRVMRWETALFGGQPSREWSAALPLLPLSEALHASYLSYYLLIFGPPLVLYVTAKRAEFQVAVFALMLTFFLHYLFFIFFPVQGPRYLFPAPGGAIANGWFYELAHVVLEAGSSQGAAFPSSHVGVAAAQSWIAWRWLPRIAPLVSVLGLGLAAGAVYGGFHYLTDVIAGALLGIAAGAAGMRWHHALDA